MEHAALEESLREPPGSGTATAGGRRSTPSNRRGRSGVTCAEGPRKRTGGRPKAGPAGGIVELGGFGSAQLGATGSLTARFSTQGKGWGPANSVPRPEVFPQGADVLAGGPQGSGGSGLPFGRNGGWRGGTAAKTLYSPGLGKGGPFAENKGGKPIWESRLGGGAQFPRGGGKRGAPSAEKTPKGARNFGPRRGPQGAGPPGLKGGPKRAGARQGGLFLCRPKGVDRGVKGPPGAPFCSGPRRNFGPLGEISGPEGKTRVFAPPWGLGTAGANFFSPGALLGRGEENRWGTGALRGAPESKNRGGLRYCAQGAPGFRGHKGGGVWSTKGPPPGPFKKSARGGGEVSRNGGGPQRGGALGGGRPRRGGKSGGPR